MFGDYYFFINTQILLQQFFTIANPHELRISTFWSSYTCPPSPPSVPHQLPQPPPSRVLCSVVGWLVGGLVGGFDEHAGIAYRESNDQKLKGQKYVVLI